MKSFCLHILAAIGANFLALVDSQLITNSKTESPSNDMLEKLVGMVSAEGNEVPITYKPGQLSVSENGLLLSTGLQSRIIAITGEPITFKDDSTSSIPFHDQPDAGAIFVDYSTDNQGGYAYVSNAEVGQNGGGVGSIIFDADGDPIDYTMILTGTTRNCGGGKTYWQTWVSCEEAGNRGQIWETDPFGRETANKTVLGGLGGNYESMAYDNRQKWKPRFFITNDKEDGELRRFTPRRLPIENGDYPSILTTPGVMAYLVINPTKGKFGWTKDLVRGKRSAKRHFPNCEGIDRRDNYLYVVCKARKEMFILNLDDRTYVKSSTASGALDGQPDQIVRLTDTDHPLLYFTEDGGRPAGIHARDRDGNYLTVAEAINFGGSPETTGLAFSPDDMHMYFAVQDDGVLFDITRTDGRPFDANTLVIKYHKVN